MYVCISEIAYIVSSGPLYLTQRHADVQQ